MSIKSQIEITVLVILEKSEILFRVFKIEGVSHAEMEDSLNQNS